MTVTGRRAIPSFTTTPRLNMIDVVTIEHIVNTQLTANMEKVRAFPRLERLMTGHSIMDRALAVTGPPTVS